MIKILIYYTHHINKGNVIIMSVSKVSIVEASRYHNISHALCQFLDDFKRAENKFDLIKDEPEDCGDPIIMCLMACIAHRSANENSLAIPEWVFKSSYFLSDPIYAHNTTIPEYQIYLRESSLPEFVQRNLFYGNNVMDRY